MSTFVDMKFSDRLRSACRSAGIEWSQTAIGRALGVKKQTADRWMGDGQPAADTVFSIADTLKVDPRWLATGQESQSARAGIDQQELEFLANYRVADPRWRLSLRLLAALATEDQIEVASDVNVVIARIFGKRPSDVRYTSNERVAAAFGEAPHVAAQHRIRGETLRTSDVTERTSDYTKSSSRWNKRKPEKK